MFLTNSGFLLLLLSQTLSVFGQSEKPPNGPHRGPFFHGVARPDFKKCKDEIGVTADEFKDLHNDPTKTPTEKQLCFLKCLATSNGVIAADGKVNTDLLKKNAPPSLSEAALNTMTSCLESVGKISSCDDISKLHKCIPHPPKRPE